MIAMTPGQTLIRCDHCALTVEARLDPQLCWRPPLGWATDHRPGYSMGSDHHRCPRCLGEGQ